MVWGLQLTGIPVSVGIASTKTLAKLANEIVKKHPLYAGVLDLSSLAVQNIDTQLEALPVDDVWGIGARYAHFLLSEGIFSAKELKDADETWIRRHLTVVGQRTVLELRGIACIPLEPEPQTKKGIMCAKTFGREIKSQEELEEAVANYVARAAEPAFIDCVYQCVHPDESVQERQSAAFGERDPASPVPDGIYA